MKTGNILLTGNNEIKIIDFGLASYVFKAEFHGGTPSYTAPEIWKGGACSVQSDIFSIGCIFYEMIMGSQLFSGDTVGEIKQKIMRSSLTPSIMRNTRVTGQILSAVVKSLQKNPAERIQSCAQYLEELFRQPEEQDIQAKKTGVHVCYPKIKPSASVNMVRQGKVKKALLKLLDQVKHTNEQTQDISIPARLGKHLEHLGEVSFHKKIAPRLGKHVLIEMLNPKGVRSNPIRALLSKIAMEALLERNDLGEELLPVLISNILTGYALGKNSAYLLAKRVENAEEILLQLLQRDDDLILRNVIHGVMALKPTEQIMEAMRDVYQRRSSWYIQEACSQYFQQVEKKNSHPSNNNDG